MIDTPTTYQSFDLPMPRTPRDEIAEHEARSGFWFGRYFGTRTRPEDEEGIVGIEDHRPTQTKLKYVWGEVTCYAKHMLPLVFVFVFVVLAIALLAYKQAIDRIVHPPPSLEP
ncbi:SPOSA6832_03947 [Sporobolomyces salmonicolor]|uniref:SPOSA6832_03947-mRNA-1:cds n=1 Tax=Sporidiobolus salmonicolor TaxID=5005 RepID=A0A0D6EQQ3_SPOSA|nr:SPOSA6832_03947 [Sporobolomyces salmonicolor]